MDKKNFIIISTADWDNPFWTNKQHVARTLSEAGHKVVYFDSLGLRNPNKNSTRDLTRIFKRLVSFLRGPRKISENLTVFSPLVAPKHSNKVVSLFNNFLMSLYLKYFELNSFSGPVIYWTYNPLSADFLKSNSIVYHCVDDLTAAPGLPVERIQREEIKLLKKSKLIFVTSKTLKNKYDGMGFSEKTFYFPNVVDEKHFSQKVDPNQVPEDLKNIGRPILGFIGAISSYKVDFNLLRQIAIEKADCSIVLIGLIGEGQPDTSIDILTGLDNIHFLGAKSYSELPKYLHFFDVAMIPCVANEYTRSMFPMKFFEYLCAEKKVVTTHLESLEEFRECCFVAQDHKSFISGINKALTSNLEEFADKNKMDEVLKEHTWNVRTNKMLRFL